MLAEGATLRAGTTPLKIPEAYRSSATHFSPIILSNQEKKSSPSKTTLPANTNKDERASRHLKELKKQLLKQHNQDGELKSSPRSTSSGSDTLSSPSQVISDQITAKPSIKTEPVTPIQSITPMRGSVPAPPVTQAVRPLPRKPTTSDNTNNAPESATSVQNTGLALPMSASGQTTTSVQVANSMPPTPITPLSTHSITHSTPVHATDTVNSLPAVSNAQPNQPIVVNNATISSPAMIPSYPSVVLQRDAATGAVSWLPVVTNMPYFTITSPQQPMAVNPVQVINQTNDTPPVAQTVSETITQPVTVSGSQSSSDQRSLGYNNVESTTINSRTIPTTVQDLSATATREQTTTSYSSQPQVVNTANDNQSQAVSRNRAKSKERLNSKSTNKGKTTSTSKGDNSSEPAKTINSQPVVVKSSSAITVKTAAMHTKPSEQMSNMTAKRQSRERKQISNEKGKFILLLVLQWISLSPCVNDLSILLQLIKN